MGKCPGILNASRETLVLTLEFGEKKLLDAPEIVAKTVKMNDVQKAIKDTMLAEAKRLSKSQMKGLATDQTGSEFGKKMLSTTTDAFTKSLKLQLENSAEFQSVKQSVRQLKCAFNESPVGYFIDKNNGWIVLVIKGLALGGAIAMYELKKGDQVADAAIKLIGKEVRYKVLGNVEMGIKDIKFKPSTQEVGFKAFSEIKWERVDLNVDFKISTKGDMLNTASAGAEIVAKVSKNLVLKASGALGTQATEELPGQALTFDAKVGLVYKPTNTGFSLQTEAYVNQNTKQRKYGGSGNIGYSIGGKTAPGGKFTLTGSGSHTRQLLGLPKPKTEYKMTFGYKVEF